MSAAAMSEPPVTRTTQDPIDFTTIRATISRALEQGPLPRYEDLVDLEALLRGHLQLLLPYAEAAVGKLNRGTVEWYQRRSFLSAIRHDLVQGLGPGMMSAQTHVTALARACTALLKYVGDES